MPDLFPYVYSVNNFVAQMLRLFCRFGFHPWPVRYHKQHICEVVLDYNIPLTFVPKQTVDNVESALSIPVLISNRTKYVDNLVISSRRCIKPLRYVATAARHKPPQSVLKCGLLNARSAKHKSNDINRPREIRDLICDKGLDLMVLTETWIRNEEDRVAIGDLTPAGYAMHNVSRPSGRRGGLAVICRNSMAVSATSLDVFSSFECMSADICYNHTLLALRVVYQPRQSSSFFDDFGDLLELLNTSNFG